MLYWRDLLESHLFQEKKNTAPPRRVIQVGSEGFQDVRSPCRGTARRSVVVQRVRTTTRRRVRYDTRCYFNVRSKADMSQLNLTHGNNN